MNEPILQKVMRRVQGHKVLEPLASSFFRALRKPVELPPYRACDTGGTSSVPKPSGPLFITARFRSGSTFLWQLFTRLPGYTAYYEPLNEQQWFTEGSRRDVDQSHRGVSNYRLNYENLDHLAHSFSKDWTCKRLAMGRNSSDPKLVAYVQGLIDAAAFRPVLQFNRIDYRLPFFRQNFPDATIVHLEREARDIWRSTLSGKENDPAWRLDRFDQHSKFYLLPFFRDLTVSFPWLSAASDQHPYLAHYLLWRLSGLYAAKWADFTVSYESLCGDFNRVAADLLVSLGDTDFDPGLVAGLMSKRIGAYDHSVDDAFYAGLEQQAEALLEQQLPAAPSQ